MIRDWLRRAWDGARDAVERGQDWSRRHLPPGVRLLAGLVLMAGGLVGFLPILGFWMLPLGIAVAALDVMPILRWWRGEVRRPFPDGEDKEYRIRRIRQWRRRRKR